ncbi:UNVERIFIED_CONTAM: hypothetical protein Slati_2105100 [Sesamum latifolium]|uniref:Uncharacterized protein n=1 Tax=Sesamum latifolium TaxID=2727402 RepID=A0AAW2WPB3_9LAMI
MFLKNLMEDKKLNLNQPLLSVRRHSMVLNTQKLDERKVDSPRPVIARIPHYRSELKSGPVGNPGAVPFQWEQAPGRPKEEIKTQTRNCSRPPISPKLPPGRCPKANSCLVSQSTNDNKIQDVNIHCDSRIAPSVDESIKDFGSSRETVEESKSSDSGDCEAYADALDTLSRTESFSLNCSTSGLTGMDDLGAKRIRPTSSSAGSYAKTEDQCKSNISELKPVDNLRTAELKENKTSVKSESGWSESHNTLAHRDEPLSLLEDTKHNGSQGYGSREKSFRTFKELLADEDSPKELDLGGSVVEKTIYVDTVQNVEDMSSCSPNTQDIGVSSSREEHNKLNAKRIDQMHVLESSLEDFKKLNTAEGEAKPNGVSSNDKSNGKSRRGTPTAFGENQEPNLHSTTTENIEVTEKEAAKYVEKQLPRTTILGNSHAKYSKFPVPPPLPKSPSDSWLCRTLPSISSKKGSPRSKARRGDIKWEARVKSTKVQHQNLHYSEVCSFFALPNFSNILLMHTFIYEHIIQLTRLPVLSGPVDSCTGNLSEPVPE